VPTALTNLLGYIGTHGYPEVGLTEADWEGEEDYDLVTTHVNNLAILAGTNAMTGTDHMDGYDAIEYFLSCRTPGVFNVTQNLATNTTGPTLRSIVENDVNGAITAVGYGIYYCIGTDIWGREVLDIDGGHYVTFTHGYRNGDTRKISYRDPDDDNNSSTQSDFENEAYDVDAVYYTRASSLFTAMFQGGRTGNRIMRTDGNKYRMIEAVVHVRPRSCYSWDSSFGLFKVAWAGVLDGVLEPPSAVPGPQGESLRDFTIGPFNNMIWYLDNQSPSTAYGVRLSNHEVTEFELPHAGTEIAFGPDHAMIILGDGKLSRLHPFADQGENAPQPKTVQIPGQPEYLAIDDATKSCWVADNGAPGENEQGVYQIPLILDMEPNLYVMPQGWRSDVAIKGLAMTGNPEMPLALLGEDGGVSLCKPASGQLIELDLIWTDGTISSIQFNDEGDMMAFGQEGMTLFRRNQDNWSVVDDHPFKDKVLSPKSVMSRNRTNYDPEIHGVDSWKQIRDPKPVAGDLDGDGVVAVDDLLIVLGNFGNDNGEGDLNDDGIVGIDDLLLLLGNWTN
ncbi:MAG: hypothetical protein VX527_11720, partial [Planctomycetota bacterium]|nr:hypothetical protein [Planctomycetota bacterium]